MSTKKVEVKHLYKIFGPRPDTAMEMIRSGVGKDELFQKTGMVLGVKDACFDVQEGEIFVLMGLSGSGKSTLIRLLNRLVEPSFGEVWLDGQDVAKLDERALIQLRRKDLAMVFQSFALLPHLTVLANTAFGLEIAGVDKGKREARAMQVLEQVGLKAFAHKKPSELSGGMQQRVGLARALAVDPTLMLMDEAFSALDPLKRTEMQDLLLDLQREQKRTIVFVSHDLDEAFKIGNRIAIMEGGRIVQVGTPAEILRNPSEAYVKAFFKGVDTKKYLVASDLAEPATVAVWSGSPGADQLSTWLAQVRASGQSLLLLVDEAGRVVGQTTEADLMLAQLDAAVWTLSTDVLCLDGQRRLGDVGREVLRAGHGVAVLDGQACLLGVITKSGLLARLMEEET